MYYMIWLPLLLGLGMAYYVAARSPSHTVEGEPGGGPKGYNLTHTHIHTYMHIYIYTYIYMYI